MRLARAGSGRGSLGGHPAARGVRRGHGRQAGKSPRVSLAPSAVSVRGGAAMSTPREVVTRVGRARWDDHRFMGHGALSELLGNETFLALTFIAATDGRRPTREERGLLDALAVSMAAADPRIWPLKITRLVAAYGGTIAGFVAGQLCTECDAIGPWVTGPAAELLLSVRDAVGLVEASEADFRAAVTRWLETHRRLSGYGVAFRADDERFLALGAHVERAGRAGLPFWR